MEKHVGVSLQGNLTLALAYIQEAVTRAPATSAAKKTTTPPFAAGHGAAAARLLRASRAAFAAAVSIPQPDDGICLRLSASRNEPATDGHMRRRTHHGAVVPFFFPPSYHVSTGSCPYSISCSRLQVCLRIFLGGV